MRECTHLPCLWPHRCPRHRDHFVTSSTPFLARSGLEALATVRVEEDTGAVPRSATGSVAFGRNGLSSSNGRLVRNRPFAHSDRFPGHKGAKLPIVEPGKKPTTGRPAADAGRLRLCVKSPISGDTFRSG